MEENSARPKRSNDEIDITEFFSWIGRGLRNFGYGIIRIIADLRSLFFSNKAFFIIIIAAGLVVGGSYSKLLKKDFYKSSMVISCDYLNNRIMQNSIEKLNLLCEEKDRGGLTEVLGIDLQVAKNIRRFSYKPFVSEKDLVEIEVLKEQLNSVAEQKKDLVQKIVSKIDIENKHAFQIEASIYNPDIVKNLEKALVNYFRNNEYVKNRVEINRVNLTSRRDKLKKESTKLDSLKAVLYQNFQSMASQSRQGSNNVILTDKYLTDPLGVYIEDLNLNNELLGIERKLYVNPDFEIIDKLTVFKEPANASLPKILVISFFLSILFGYLLIGVWKFDRYLASVSKRPA